MHSFSFRSLRTAVAGLAGIATMLVLQGCSGGMGTQTAAPQGIQGTVMGGQQPVTGATIQLYAAVNTGLLQLAAPLITAPPTTGAGGRFNISNTYTCPTPQTDVYLVATGGNPGLGVGTNNAGLALMAALGPCGNLSSTTTVIINELTTVASVYALAPFMGTGGGTVLSTNNTVQGNLGLSNAFATVNNLVDTTRGITPGPSLPAGSTAPNAELATLANIIATCVNSNGMTGECSTLFAAATPPLGTPPANTIDVVLDIATNPINNVSTLFMLGTGTPPFQPALSMAPNDWSLAITYSNPDLRGPYGIAIDANQNIWVANNDNSSLSKFSNTGTELTNVATGGLSLPHAVAVDTGGHIWVGNTGTVSLSNFDNNGVALSPSGGYTGNGLSDPEGITVGIANFIWVANQGSNVVSKFNQSGAPDTGSPYPGNSLGNPSSFAIDNAGQNFWIADFSTNGLSEFTTTGVEETMTVPFTGGGLQNPNNVAVDRNGDVWLTSATNGTVSKFITGTSSFVGTGFATLNTGHSSGLAIDGNDNVWTSNPVTNSISELDNNGNLLTGPNGIGQSPVMMIEANKMAIDCSGNIWVTNEGTSTLTEVIGAAGPVVNPIVTAAAGSLLGTRP